MLKGHGLHHHKHHVRFYIVLMTLVIAGIFIFTMINDKHEGFSLTNAAVSGLIGGVEGIDGAEGERGIFKSERSTVQGEREISFLLSFDKIPAVAQEAKIEQIELKFDDLTTTIKVNNDKLELNDLKEVILGMTGFSGKVNFDQTHFSLDGTSSRIEINDIAFSSENDLDISFDNLLYSSIAISNLELRVLELPAGDGELQVGERMQYELQGDGVRILGFKGTFNADKGNATFVLMEGTTQGLGVSSAVLELDLY